MAEKIRIPIEVESAKATKDLNKLNNAVDNLGKESKKIQGGLNSLAGILKGGFGVGLAMSALDGLKGAFSSSQKGADMMARAQITLEAAFRETIKVLEPLYGWLGKLFKDPMKSLKEFGQFLADNIYNRLEGLLLLIPRLGTAISLLLKGEFKEAGKVAVNAVAQIATGVEDTIGTVTKAYEEVGKAATKVFNASKKAFGKSEDIVKARKETEKLQILYQGIVEQYDEMAEKQRQIRDDESQTITDRIEANKQLAKVLEEGKNAELANIQKRIGNLQLELGLNKDNLDLQNQILALRQEEKGVAAKYRGLESEQLTNINSLQKESIEMKRAEIEGTIEANRIIADSNAELAKEGQEQFDAKMKAITDEYEARKKLSDEQLKGLKEGTQAFVDATNERLTLEATYKAESKALAKERADYEIEQSKLVAENQLSTISGALSGVQALVGENSRFGKALAVAQAIIDTYSGATKALAQGGTFGYIGAAGVIASGLANVRAIMQQELPGVPDGGGGGSASISAPTGPSVGIISGQLNSSAQVLGSLNQSLSTPPRAYVVGQDVSTQQSLDRHILQNATI